jgi:hypothetical protein
MRMYEMLDLHERIPRRHVVNCCNEPVLSVDMPYVEVVLAIT